MSTFHGTEIDIGIERLAAEGQIQKEFIGTLNGNTANQIMFTKNFPITWDAGEAGGVTGAASGVGTDTIFETDLTAANDFYNGMTIRFTSGGNSGEMRVISDYAQANGEITVASAFTGAPGAADAFIIEPSVNVYTDDGTPGSWTEYAEDGTEYIIAGLTGTVTIQAAENQGGNAGERISIDYYTTSAVARGQGITIEQDGNVISVHELGNRNPVEIKEGKIEIDITIDNLYLTRDMLGKVLGVADFTKRLAAFSTFLYPGGKTQGQPRIKVSNAKYGFGNIKVDLDTIVATQVKGKGTVVDIDSVP